MRLLADENIYQANVEYLRALKHDVKYISEIASGATDEKILNLCLKDKRILISLDKDFADIRYLPRKCPGIIILRVKPPTVRQINSALEGLFNRIATKKIENSLIVLEENGFRRREL